MFLPDVNLWLALAFDAHFHHAAAKCWYDSVSGESCFFCRMTRQGFLRLATNSRVFGDDAVSMSQGWGIYDMILSDPRIGFAEEPANLEPLWRNYTHSRTFSPKLWNDAYLAAFARASAFELITFDQGFSQYADLHHTILT